MIKNITVQGIGIALFVVLSLCLQVPIFENYYLCLGYITMSVYLYSFGITSGMIVGVIGTILYCFIINGLRGLPGWAIGNVVIALMVGLSFHLGKKISNKIIKYIIYIFGIVIGCCFGILVTKSVVEHFLYAQPIIIRMMSNIYAFVADIVVLFISIPICEKMDIYIGRLNQILMIKEI